MVSSKGLLICAILALGMIKSAPLLAQISAARQKLAGTESIGDAVQPTNRLDKQSAGASHAPEVFAVSSPSRVRVIYVHGIYEEGPNDSNLLRWGMCKYLKECDVRGPKRIFADGPFAVDAARPELEFMGQQIWESQTEWNASAPFIDEYEISGGGMIPIVLDELNWYPLAYPLKCKFLIKQEAYLAGTTTKELDACFVPGAKTSIGDPYPDTDPDSNHHGRYKDYRWISAAEVREMKSQHHGAELVNRNIKGGLMDFGFGDAVMALGPMHEILCSAIRELLSKALATGGIDVAEADEPSNQDEVFFVTHSLGSYLSLEAMDPAALGREDALFKEFRPSASEVGAANYFANRTKGFYFLANQIELLELARLSLPTAKAESADPCEQEEKLKEQSADQTTTAILHWRCSRKQFGAKTGTTLSTQIIAWNDRNDLLSWEVPDGLGGVTPVNVPANNSAGFRIPWLFAWPGGVHQNYAKNKMVIEEIFKPNLTSSAPRK